MPSHGRGDRVAVSRTHRRGPAKAIAALLVAAGKKRGGDHRSPPRGLKISIEWRRAPQAADVVTAPYPGFPTDLQAQIMALLTVAEVARR